MRNFEAHNGPKRIRKQGGPLDFGAPGQDDPDPNWDWEAEMAQHQPEPEPDPEGFRQERSDRNDLSYSMQELEKIVEQIQVGGVKNLDEAAQQLTALAAYIRKTGYHPYSGLLDYAASEVQGSAYEMDQQGFGWASPAKIKELLHDLEYMLEEMRDMWQRQSSHKKADATYDQWMGTPSMDNTGTEDWSVDQILDAPYSEEYSDKMQPTNSLGAGPVLGDLRQALDIIRDKQLDPRGINWLPFITDFREAVKGMPRAAYYEASFSRLIRSIAEGSSEEAFSELDALESGMSSDKKKHRQADATHDNWMGTPSMDNQGLYDWDEQRDLWGAPKPEHDPEQRQQPTNSQAAGVIQEMRDFFSQLEPEQVDSKVSQDYFKSLCTKLAQALDETLGPEGTAEAINLGQNIFWAFRKGDFYEALDLLNEAESLVA